LFLLSPLARNNLQCVTRPNHDASAEPTHVLDRGWKSLAPAGISRGTHQIHDCQVDCFMVGLGVPCAARRVEERTPDADPDIADGELDLLARSVRTLNYCR
jgi:hypothetical protein